MPVEPPSPPSDRLPMSTITAINPKGPRRPKPGADPAAWAETYLASTVGAKVLVALTGLGLTGFVVFHMVGNLKLFAGPDAINGYAYFLKHELGAYLWAGRLGLLALFAVHLALAFRLKAKSVAARPVGYVYQRSAQATLASQTMIWTGVVILLFVVLHLAHFTFGWVAEVELPNGQHVNYLELKDADGRHDVYSMMVAGFRNPVVALFYIVCQLLIGVHLSHGIQSTVQTLGLKNGRFAPAWVGLGYAVAAGIVIGNCAIVLAAWTGFIPPVMSGNK